MILSYHDRSDGGLITTLLEASFAGHVGIDIDYKNNINDINKYMFNEELGVIMQVSNKLLDEVQRVYSDNNILNSVSYAVDNSKANMLSDKRISLPHLQHGTVGKVNFFFFGISLISKLYANSTIVHISAVGILQFGLIKP